MQIKPISAELLAQILSPNWQRRFWSKVDKRRPDECWPFTGSVGDKGKGYGRVGVGGRSCPRVLMSHRVAWVSTHGKDVPPDLCILHSCIASRNCCNPKHLRPGTYLDNARDKVNQRRQHKPKGELDGRALLTAEQVLEIRSIYPSGKLSQKKLGKSYGVSAATIDGIIHRRSWTHI